MLLLVYLQVVLQSQYLIFQLEVFTLLLLGNSPLVIELVRYNI
jgi:hypothetical protein